MNLLTLFDWVVHMPESVISLPVINGKHSSYILRLVPPLTCSMLIGWISFKLLSSFWSHPSSNISSKLFEDFNRILLSNDNETDEDGTDNNFQRISRLPAVLVDLMAFDSNIATLRQQMSSHPETTIRIASKSLRVPSLLNRILSTGLPFKGLMCFAVEEAQFLSNIGFDDILIGYPTQQKLDYQILRDLHDKQQKLIRIVVDNTKAIEQMNEFMDGINKPFPVIIEFDASFRLLQGRIHVGARRSPIRTISQLIEVIELIQRLPFLRLEGLMVYESHIAGIGDTNPVNFWLNPIIRLVKAYSIPQIQQLRREIGQLCSKYGLTLFNGGGTGSLLSTLAESSVLTEITVGSGFFQPHLFDHYQQNQLMIKKYNTTLLPSCYFALPVGRISDEAEWVTCLGGGYVASGKPGRDKIPIPVFPFGLKVSGDEGTGEVQTPLKIDKRRKKETMKILKQHGIVYFRHAKGGELAERFMKFLLIENGKIVETAKTYRGYGQCFF
jgi:D-serine deaminase-like pyridoxal phosphate-dependent protein